MADIDLLSRFVRDADEAAFAELVRLRVNLVYGTALRTLDGDGHLARDVAQQVFNDLAQKAPSLLGRRELVGWLHASTRFAAINARRKQRRWLHREEEAQFMKDIAASGTPGPEWDRVRPVLDEAMSALADDDRSAVLLRFLEGKSFAEIGAEIGIRENAARMRVERALEKLRTALARRGIASTAAALVSTLSAQSPVQAPVGLAATISAGALAPAGQIPAASASFLIMSKATPAIVTFALAVGIGTLGYKMSQSKTGPQMSAEVQAGAAPDLQTSTSDAVSVSPSPAQPVETPSAIARSSTSDPRLELDPLGKSPEGPLPVNIFTAAAITGFKAAHNGADPVTVGDVVPYFADPQHAALYVRSRWMQDGIAETVSRYRNATGSEPPSEPRARYLSLLQYAPSPELAAEFRRMLESEEARQVALLEYYTARAKLKKENGDLAGAAEDEKRAEQAKAE